MCIDNQSNQNNVPFFIARGEACTTLGTAVSWPPPLPRPRAGRDTGGRTCGSWGPMRYCPHWQVNGGFRAAAWERRAGARFSTTQKSRQWTCNALAFV
jgi:hypothetical protein